MKYAPDPMDPTSSKRMADQKPWLVMLGLMAALIVPAFFALDTVVEPLPIPDHSKDISPRGYTWSLLLWVVPIFFVLISFRRSIFDRTRIQLWGAVMTIALLTILSVVLELLLGLRFYTFENPEATVGRGIRVVGGYIPIEEFAFYILGYIAILLFYIWCDEIWLAHYNPLDYEQEIRRESEESGDPLAAVGKYLRNLTIRFLIVSMAVAMVTASIFLSTTEWPQYLVFILVASVMPVLLFIHVSHRFVNWRALSLVFFACLLVSLLWETTLGIPYRWWGYKEAYMLQALRARPWSNLPVEAYLVWMLAPYTIVTVYETAKLWWAATLVRQTLFQELGAASLEAVIENESVLGKKA
jgi:hypothetical protein